MATASAIQIGSFIEIMAPLAMEQAKKHQGRLFASVCIAQAAHETGWGAGSPTMMRYNAPFGIKVGNSAYHFGTAWKGASYNSKTTEYYDKNKQIASEIRDNFRAYSSLSDATEDYMDMLCTASRYRGAVGCSTPEESIRAIVNGGYATGPAYAEKIIQIINSKTYNLKKYDVGSLSDSINPYTLTATLLKKGSKGESVKWLQWQLNKNGANVKIDGIFGQQTKLSVILYQKDHGLVQDGIVGKCTFKALKGGS